jgi:SSS family solute:Na+ symporter
LIVQRVLSAQSIDEARWGALFAGLLKLPVLFLMVLPGTCALLLFPHLTQSDRVYPRLILELLPSGTLGLVVAGFVAAAMVACASMFNSASSLITMDVIKVLKPTLSDRQLVKAGRLSTAGLMVFAVAWAPQLHLFTSLWQYLQSVLAYTVPPVVAVFVLGLFWRGATADGAAAALRIGFGCGLALFLINVVFRWTHFHFLYAAPILISVDTLILVGVSLYRPEPLSAARAAVMWQPQLWRAEREHLATGPAWRDYRYQSALLLLLAAVIVFVFR